VGPRQSLARDVADHAEGRRNFALALAALPTRGVEGRVVSLVVFVLDGQRYALRLSAVENVLPMVEVSPLPKAPAIALGVINLHGAVVPVLDLRRRLGFPSRDYGPTAHLLVTMTEARRVALPVDEVLGVRDVAADTVISPDEVLPATAHVAGIVPLPDGLIFIHDLEAFLSLDEQRHLAEALEQRA
jgi:purine-binding chemotaxis protein CheW